MSDNMFVLGKSRDELMDIASQLKTLVKTREDAIFEEKVKQANEKANTTFVKTR